MMMMIRRVLRTKRIQNGRFQEFLVILIIIPILRQHVQLNDQKSFHEYSWSRHDRSGLSVNRKRMECMNWIVVLQYHAFLDILSTQQNTSTDRGGGNKIMSVTSRDLCRGYR
jgi:hypothetical protein